MGNAKGYKIVYSADFPSNSNNISKSMLNDKIEGAKFINDEKTLPLYNINNNTRSQEDNKVESYTIEMDYRSSIVRSARFLHKRPFKSL